MSVEQADEVAPAEDNPVVGNPVVGNPVVGNPEVDWFVDDIRHVVGTPVVVPVGGTQMGNQLEVDNLLPRVFHHRMVEHNKVVERR